MAMSDAGANALALYLFNSTAISGLGTDFYASLHTGSPVAGTQATSEATYTSYARVACARDDTSVFSVSSNTVTTVAAITFPECTGSTDTITHVGLGVGSSGATLLLMVATCSLSVSTGITPEFAIGDLDWTIVADAT